MKRKKVIDLFSGCGGLSYGFMMAGYEVLLGLDNNKVASETFIRNHGNAIAICKDMDLYYKKSGAKRLMSL